MLSQWCRSCWLQWGDVICLEWAMLSQCVFCQDSNVCILCQVVWWHSRFVWLAFALTQCLFKKECVPGSVLWFWEMGDSGLPSCRGHACVQKGFPKPCWAIKFLFKWIVTTVIIVIFRVVLKVMNFMLLLPRLQNTKYYGILAGFDVVWVRDTSQLSHAELD